MAYCTRQNVIDRLSDAGTLYCVDDDQDGTLDASEGTLVDNVITSIGAEIAFYLTPIIETPSSAEGNQWLTDRCVDLAAARLAARKGRKVPKSLADAEEQAREWLDMVAARTMRVPDLVYPEDVDITSRRRLGRPYVGNPS